MVKFLVDVTEDLLWEDVEFLSDAVLMISETCYLNEKQRKKFQYSEDVEEAITKGSFYFRTSSEFQRGLLMAKVIAKEPNVRVFTSRPEVIGKIILKAKVEAWHVKKIDEEVKKVEEVKKIEEEVKVPKKDLVEGNIRRDASPEKIVKDTENKVSLPSTFANPNPSNLLAGYKKPASFLNPNGSSGFPVPNTTVNKLFSMSPSLINENKPIASSNSFQAKNPFSDLNKAPNESFILENNRIVEENNKKIEEENNRKIVEENKRKTVEENNKKIEESNRKIAEENKIPVSIHQVVPVIHGERSFSSPPGPNDMIKLIKKNTDPGQLKIDNKSQENPIFFSKEPEKSLFPETTKISVPVKNILYSLPIPPTIPLIQKPPAETKGNVMPQIKGKTLLEDQIISSSLKAADFYQVRQFKDLFSITYKNLLKITQNIDSRSLDSVKSSISAILESGYFEISKGRSPADLFSKNCWDAELSVNTNYQNKK